MTKKFTEEQYQKIVTLQESEFPNNILAEGMNEDKTIWYYLSESAKSLRGYIVLNGLYNETAAFFNPLTREWAHDKFVEKEKRYVWHLRGKHKHTDKARLFKDSEDNSVGIYWTEQDNRFSEQEKLTESEIKSWGYNPEMFDKEEV